MAYALLDVEGLARVPEVARGGARPAWVTDTLRYRVPLPKQGPARTYTEDDALRDWLLGGMLRAEAAPTTTRRTDDEAVSPKFHEWMSEGIHRVADWVDPSTGEQLTRLQAWRALQEEIRAFKGPGTHRRLNLAPDAERDRTGKYHKTALPSDVVKDGHPIFELCRFLAPPDFDFNMVQVNRFRNHKQCQPHVDKRNVGDSLWAMLGDCTGGALRLADGRRFVRKRRWHRYNGALVEHSVEKFKGERLTVVL